MEERMIDEEYGRGIRLRRTEDGYVDVTDAALDDEAQAGEEITFEYPVMDEDADDEDLVSLSLEEAMKLRREKEEAAAERRAEYEKICQAAEELLEAGNFNEAELQFEKAMQLDKKATEATVGYWRAKTANFDDAEGLVGEYADEGVENLEYDLGSEAVDIIRKQYREKFLARHEEVSAEEKVLSEKVLSAQDRRRGVLKTSLIRTGIFFGVSFALVAMAAIFAISFGLKNFTVSDGKFIIPTIVAAVIFFLFFVVFGFCTNKFINAFRIYRSNERLSSTEEGARLVQLRDYKEIYEFLLK